ncbi:sensor domain-containing diguanylate cyclase [Sphingomonas koreensis]|nr:sensor domain-containing diguanylate cyclase [Sphingomonas koreensis]
MSFASRPSSLSRPIVIGAAYGVAASTTILLTRFDGGVAHLWVATALLLAELAFIPRDRWRPTLVSCATASFIATAIFGFGLAAALPLAVINISEAFIGALLLRWITTKNGYLESIASVAVFALAAGAVGPALSGVAGAAVATWMTGIGFWQNWIGWVVGHGLGTLTFAPICAMILRDELEEWIYRATVRMKLEAIMLMLAMISICWLVFAQTTMPLLFVPMLPMMVITFRMGRPGAAAAIVLLTVVGGIMTARGLGPINLIPGSAGMRSEFFQFYLAVTVLIVLPIAAELNHRKLIFRQLQESEARYKLITDTATDMLLTFDLDGTIRYASPSTQEIAGYSPSLMIGKKGRAFIDPRDHDIVINAHRQALAEVGVTHSVVYRAPTEGNGTRWFEAQTRGIADESGRPTGVVCAIRDISDRKLLEQHLSHAASTDPLTGVANRRLFDLRLEADLAGTHGCVAIFDLDHFKRVNDLYGHETGDRVLKAFADEATRIMPADYLIARLGGEEFGVIFAGADSEEAAKWSNRLRQATAGLCIETVIGSAVDVTVSVGISEFVAGSERADILRAADHALYSAKAAGRDRLRIAA